MAMRNNAYSGFMKKVIWMGSSKADMKVFPLLSWTTWGTSCFWCNADSNLMTGNQ